jgi:hypothetical protein
VQQINTGVAALAAAIRESRALVNNTNSKASAAATKTNAEIQ